MALEEDRIAISKQTLSRELRAMDYRKLSARPCHDARKDEAARLFKSIYGPAVRRKRAVSGWGETVRINLSGLSMEHLLRAIMGIRAHRACLDLRPQRAIFKTRLGCAGQPFVHSVTSFSRTTESRWLNCRWRSPLRLRER